MQKILGRLDFTLSGRFGGEKTTKTCQKTSGPPGCPSSLSYVIRPDRMLRIIENCYRVALVNATKTPLPTNRSTCSGACLSSKAHDRDSTKQFVQYAF